MNKNQEPISGAAAEAAVHAETGETAGVAIKKPGADRMAAARAALAKKRAEAKKKSLQTE